MLIFHCIINVITVKQLYNFCNELIMVDPYELPKNNIQNYIYHVYNKH